VPEDTVREEVKNQGYGMVGQREGPKGVRGGGGGHRVNSGKCCRTMGGSL